MWVAPLHQITVRCVAELCGDLTVAQWTKLHDEMLEACRFAIRECCDDNAESMAWATILSPGPCTFFCALGGSGMEDLPMVTSEELEENPLDGVLNQFKDWVYTHLYHKIHDKVLPPLPLEECIQCFPGNNVF
ncbi:E4 ORFA [Murine mastadenovirus A]|uniref:E4 ORFA n=1 Tax=Murine mastadenovirus A TaxID=129956 RepID=UPI00001D96CD|nr:E4 ORFA [Murine mastadenovirus A]